MGDTTTQQSESESVLHMEHKCVGISGFKAHKDDGEEGLVEAIVSVTGLRDNVKDVIKPGAYEKSLKVRTPKGVWHHSWSESVSRTEGIKELLPGDPELPDKLPNGEPWPKDAGALKVKTRFNLNTQRGREAYEDVIFFGDQQEWSIGYNVPVGGATVDSKSGVRSIHTLELYEYSPVLFGAMPSARTSSVKDAQMAYKSLQVGEGTEVAPNTPEVVEGEDSTEAPDDDVEDDIEDGVEDDVDELTLFDDFDNEAKQWGFLDGEGYFTKSSPRQIGVSPAQAQKVYRALASLSELLRDMRVDLEEDGVTEQGTAPAGEETEGAEEGAEQPDFSSTSLTELVADVLDDEDAQAAAKDFDAAVEAEDREAMEEAADSIIDAIEAAIEDGEDKANFSNVGGYIAWAVEQVGDEEDTDEEDPDEENEEEEDSDSENEEKGLSPSSDETFRFDLNEVKSLLE